MCGPPTMILVSGSACFTFRAICADPQTPTVNSVMPTYFGAAAMMRSATPSKSRPRMSLSRIVGS